MFYQNLTKIRDSIDISHRKIGDKQFVYIYVNQKH